MINRLGLLLCLVGSAINPIKGMAEVICFDVAQGNSVLVGSTDPHETALPCLIDAGCKSYTYRGKNFNGEQVVRIVEALRRFAKISKQEFYNIIISHPDEDHYNLLPDIVERCRVHGLEPYKIILGGVRALYNEAFQTFLDGLTAQPKDTDSESSSSEMDSEEDVSSSESEENESYNEDDSSRYNEEEEISVHTLVDSYMHTLVDNYNGEEHDLSQGNSNFDEEGYYDSYYEEFTEVESKSSKSRSDEDEVHVPTITYHTQGGDTTKLVEIDSGTRLTYSILPAKKATSEGEKNDGSLVVLIGHEDLLFLVAGDATDKTTDHILKYCPDLKVQGLHAGHHGAQEHGCNSVKWLKTLEPEAIVFSSGLHKGNRHPQGAILARASKYLPDGDGPYRPLYSGTTKKNDYSDRFFNGIALSGYGLSVTQKNMFGTLGQGTITFSMAPEDTELRAPVCSLGLTYPDKKSCVLESLLNSPETILPLNMLVTLDLSSLGINDGVATDRDRLHRLLTALKDGGDYLNNVFLQDNSISKPLSVTNVIALLDARKYIKVLNMKKNGLSQLQKNRLNKKKTKRREIRL